MNEASENNLIQNEDDLSSQNFIEWKTHPMRKRPAAAAIVTIFILVVGMLVYSMTDSKAFAVLALVVLFMSLAKFYMPTRFKLTGKEIIVKSTTQTIIKEWSMFRSFYPDKNGVLLSPFVRPSRMENFRGLYLMFNDNRDDVLSFVESHITNVLDEIEEEEGNA